jgi:hypothetical protein
VRKSVKVQAGRDFTDKVYPLLQLPQPMNFLGNPLNQVSKVGRCLWAFIEGYFQQLFIGQCPVITGKNN